MNGKKVFVIGADVYANWLPMEITDKIEDADLVLFTGGEDVSPELYGDERHRTTMSSHRRDMEDIKHYKYALNNEVPMLGICRGSQFLTAMQPRGRLIQDVNHHGIGGTHAIEDKDGNVLEITSTHHQMHYPFAMEKENYELIAWSLNRRSKHYVIGKGTFRVMQDGFKESEIIYFPKSNALGVQGHPEHLDYAHDTNKYLRKLVKSKLFA